MRIVTLVIAAMPLSGCEAAPDRTPDGTTLVASRVKP